MARINNVTLNLDPSVSPDVVGYRMYYEVAGSNPVSYDSPFIALDASLVYDLSAFAELQAVDDVFDVAFSSIDDAGNESDLGAAVANVPFDFTVPTAPVGAHFGSGA